MINATTTLHDVSKVTISTKEHSEEDGQIDFTVMYINIDTVWLEKTSSYTVQLFLTKGAEPNITIQPERAK